VTRWTPETGDPDISKAFLLGWRLGIALDWAATGTHEAWPDDDPGLDTDSRWAVLKGQIELAATELTSGVGRPSPLPTLGDTPPEPKSGGVSSYRAEVARRLYITGQFRGLALSTGCDLEGACAGTRRVPSLDATSTSPASGPSSGTEPGSGVPSTAAGGLRSDIPALKKALLGLATKLPGNAAHSVINSLTLWEEQLKGEEATFNPDVLRKQGGVWRSILSGDVAARDLLCLPDYVGTGQEVALQLKSLATGTMRRTLLVPVVGVVLLAIAGFVLLLFSRTAAAGAGTLLAALGLTWKGVGQYLGKAAAGAEQSLWDAQLDWTIAYRTTMSISERPAPTPPRMPKVMPRAHAQQADHYATWQAWRRQWPTFELEA
jgi:hypothetical protein